MRVNRLRLGRRVKSSRNTPKRRNVKRRKKPSHSSGSTRSRNQRQVHCKPRAASTRRPRLPHGLLSLHCPGGGARIIREYLTEIVVTDSYAAGRGRCRI